MTEQSQADLLESLSRQVAILESRISTYERQNLEALLGIGLPGRVGGIGSMPAPPPVGGGPIQPAAVIAPGAVTGDAIAGDAIFSPAQFAASIRPIILVTVLPTLPHADYPVGSFVYKTNDVPPRLYKNVADVWVAAVGPDDIQANSITAGQIAAGAVSTSELAVGARLTGEVANETGSTPGVFIDNTGILIRNGKLVFQDAYGQTAMSGAGFGPSWRRFLQAGVFNGDFVAAPPTPANELNDSTNPLPQWSYVKSSGTAIVFKSKTDAATGSGRYIEMDCASGAANDQSYIQQVVPIVASKNRAFTFSPYSFVDPDTTSADVEVFLEWQFLKSDLSTTGTGEFVVKATSILSGTGSELGLETEIGHGTHPPEDAYFVRFRVGMKRKPGGSTSATATVRLYETSMVAGGPRLHVAEQADPTTYSRGTIVQTNGVLALASDSLGSGIGALQIDTPGQLVQAVDSDLVVDGELTVGSVVGGTYTPSVTGGGTATFTTAQGDYIKLGKWVFVRIFLLVNAAGSGATAISVSTPSTVDKTYRNALAGNGSGLSAQNGSIIGLGFHGVANAATLDRVVGSTGTAITGANLSNGATIVLAGFYIEA